MFVPLHDDNPIRHISRPYVTWGLIVVTCIVFVMGATDGGSRALASFAIVPIELLRMGIWGGPARGVYDTVAVPERYTLITYMFLHGDIFHLTGNMLFLWVFGDNVEDRLGHFRFLGFYLICGIAGGLAHALMLPGSDAPLIGASGAVAGVVMAYLLMYPRVRVWVLVLRALPIRINAAWALGAWVASQFAMLALPYIVKGIELGPVSWWAHIGGIVAGGLLILVLPLASVASAK